MKTDQKETTRLGEYGHGEWKTKVVVKREGNFTRGGPDVVDEIEIFSGYENSIVMRFQCAYEFVYYPFDTQVILKVYSLKNLPGLLN